MGENELVLSQGKCGDSIPQIFVPSQTLRRIPQTVKEEATENNCDEMAGMVEVINDQVGICAKSIDNQRGC